MTTSITDVVIAGGSFAGLALAAVLSRAGGGDVRVHVVSPVFPAPTTGSQTGDLRATALSRGSLRLLDAIGVWPDLAGDAQVVRCIELTDSALEDAHRPTVLTYDLAADPAVERSLPAMVPAMVIVENQRLATALMTAARASPGVTLIEAASVAAYASDVDGTRVALDSGEILVARLLVAADGGRSRLRALAGIGTVGGPYAQSGIVTVVRAEHSHDGIAVQHFLPGGPFALLPMTGNRVCVTWTEDEAEAKRILALDPDGFLHELELRAGPRLGRLNVLAAPKSWPLELAIARRLVAPRLALIGDAAHTLHPIAGQGLNLGLRDVAALADAVLGAALLGLDVGASGVLTAYERRRRFDNLASATGFDVLNRIFSTRSTLARSARDAALSIADGLPVLKSWIMAEASGDLGADFTALAALLAPIAEVDPALPRLPSYPGLT